MFCRHGRPIRCMLDRDEDMKCSGTRHSFLGKYQVRSFHLSPHRIRISCTPADMFTPPLSLWLQVGLIAGKIVAVDIKLYSNGGNTADRSLAVSTGYRDCNNNHSTLRLITSAFMSLCAVHCGWFGNIFDSSISSIM